MQGSEIRKISSALLPSFLLSININPHSSNGEQAIEVSDIHFPELPTLIFFTLHFSENGFSIMNGEEIPMVVAR